MKILPMEDQLFHEDV